MHLHADHSLFFEHRQSLRQTTFVFMLTCCVLVANVAVDSAMFSLLGAVVGLMMLLFAYSRGHRRLQPAIAWGLSLVILALIGGGILRFDYRLVVKTSARLLCGVMWILWLGSQVDWVSFRQLLLRIWIPESVVASLDHALIHGLLTKREWTQRIATARLRLGASRLPLAVWGPLLGGGALHAFMRIEDAEENAMMRSAPCEDVDDKEVLRLDNVDVERGGQQVLEQLELCLQKGEWVLVCGPSGAGKSSLLRLLAGLDAVTKGSMTRFGSHLSPSTTLHSRLDGRVALMGQNPEHHFVASTVAEDIAWGLLHRGADVEEAQRRSRSVATALHIEHLLERPCHQLSFGEQRRVALAGLLVLKPTLLLLDEPTAGLDPVSAHELLALIETSVREMGATCVWATHDLHSLPPLATRVVLVRERRILFDGPRSEGLSKPWLVRAGLAIAQEEQN